MTTTEGVLFLTMLGVLLVSLTSVRAAYRWPELGPFAHLLPKEETVAITRQEVIAKVTGLVNNGYGGDFKKAFDFYAKGTGKIDEPNVLQILADAGVGSGLGCRVQRYIAAGEIIDLLDTDGDGAIHWGEFNAVFNGGK